MPNLGRYEIIEQLGQGSMGAVFKARDPLVGRDVAVKRISVQAGDGPEAAEFRQRFFVEARAAGRLAHPGIVTVFDVSEQDGAPFLVMEYVAGRTLQSLLESSERMDLDRVCDLAVQLAEALDYAHRSGVIHRDIKPANILVTPDGRLKIADFGVAKLIESQVTASGRILGTPAFMAPEQFTGMPIDGRSDLFSLGVVLYCMATGEKPFSGDTIIGVQYRVVHTEAVSPRRLNPAIPQGLETIILKCIEKSPSERYQSGQELARDLRACAAGEPIPQMKPASATSAEGTVVLEPEMKDPNVKGTEASDRTVRRRVSVALLVLIPFVAAFVAFSTFFWADSAQPDAPAAASSPVSRVPIASVDAPPSIEATTPEIPTELTQPTVETATKNRPTPPSAPVAPPPSPDKPRTTVATVSTAPSPVVKTAEVNVENLPLAAAPEAVSRRVQESPVAEFKDADDAPPQGGASDQSYKSARLLIGSLAVPEPLTIIVNVGNETVFVRSSTMAAPFGFESLDGRIRTQSAPSKPMSEERPVAPGNHKVQVNVLLGTKRVAKVQEVSGRFFSGQRRVLHIEFLPESQTSIGREATLFKVTLK
jgi:serine/threonine-protein kinase